jgi:hypothetical protein
LIRKWSSRLGTLVKIDAEGNKVEPSESEVDSGGFAIPSTLHRRGPKSASARHDRTGGKFSARKQRTIGALT